MSMRKRFAAFILSVMLLAAFLCPSYAAAASIPQEETPNYKVAFYAFDCYHMQDKNGRRTGYGYEMMQNLSQYLQCTFSYVGYDKSAAECVEMLRSGELDLYTAARLTDERAQEFAFSTHPSITSSTCMNVKVGNTKVVAGDYSTYNGLRIGLLRRHTYNDRFLAWAKEKAFDCDIIYYDTPTELSAALINDEVDALVNSYIRTPEDERVVEDFGQTPYYIMARKEDQALIDAIDQAMDAMNVETPNWRVELYNKYYGAQELNTELTRDEQALLTQLQADKAVIRAVMDPDGNPYSWYEDGEAHGIAADIFRSTAQRLGLSYEIVPVSTRAEYLEVLAAGDVDVWMDLDSYYEDERDFKYRITAPYMTTTVSVLRGRGASGRIKKLAVIDNNISAQEIISSNWPEAAIIQADDAQHCVQLITSGAVDGALMMTYTAQKLSRDDLQNRLRVDIVPGATLPLQMGVNANDDRRFYGIWEKTLSEVAAQKSAEVIQSYVEETATPTFLAYLFDHPAYLISLIVAALLFVFLVLLYFQSVRSKRRQQLISAELADALEEAKRATAAKQDFFSKMSHDIRTPLNVVLGMTQIAQKYIDEPSRLNSALDSIASEGNYLLVLINSILDVNQLEHGHVELQNAPFSPAACMQNSIDVLRPLADKKDQRLSMQCACTDWVVLGDANRFSQIMINIVSNAIKYTGAGGQIDVRIDRLPDGRCRFVCQDNGIGMTPEFVQHITEEYVRAEDSRVSKTQGTGLGMSVVAGFTELMHGTLRIKSAPGKGSTFTVELPLAEASPEQRAAVLAAPENKPNGSSLYEGRTALLAEDNALNAEIAIELLQTIGLTVDWAENGQVAVERFTASEPGHYFAVFMDMQMPVMDGIEATERIRSSGRSDCDIPIFAMTANTFATDRQRCRDAGMNGYIPKPINIEEITSTLKDGMET